MSNPKSLQRTLLACNACKRRKVRCNGLEPCQQCQNHYLPCVYAAAPIVARGRSRLGTAERGAVIAKSREQKDSMALQPPLSRALHTPGHNLDFFYDLIPLYMHHVYPITPIFDEAELHANIQEIDTSSDAASLAYAWAATTLLSMQNVKPWTPTCYDQATKMISLSINYYEPLNLDSKPTLDRLLSRLFLEMCLLILRKCELAFFYLREAMSLMLMQGLDCFLDGAMSSPKERARRERVYWVCFIHERHLSVEASTAVCLDPLPSLPDVTGCTSDSLERGWNYIIQTFLVVDKDFVSFWTSDRSLVTAEWIQKKHQELTDDSWQLEVASLPITQQADLIITRQWLRTLTWQMAMSNVLLSSEAGQVEGLSLFMPLRLSSQIKEFLTRMSSEAIEVHGMGLIEKLFEITTTIADLVVALPPGDSPEETRSAILDLLFAKQFLLALPHVKPIHKKIIQDKICRIKSIHSFNGLDDLFRDGDLS